MGAFRGVVGISEKCDSITEGYDDTILRLPDNKEDYTKADLYELADHMIERWKKFKENIDKYVN